MTVTDATAPYTVDVAVTTGAGRRHRSHLPREAHGRVGQGLGLLQRDGRVHLRRHRADGDGLHDGLHPGRERHLRRGRGDPGHRHLLREDGGDGLADDHAERRRGRTAPPRTPRRDPPTRRRSSPTRWRRATWTPTASASTRAASCWPAAATIEDEAGNAATLAHSGMATQAAHKADGVAARGADGDGGGGRHGGGAELERPGRFEHHRLPVPAEGGGRELRQLDRHLRQRRDHHVPHGHEPRERHGLQLPGARGGRAGRGARRRPRSRRRRRRRTARRRR